MRTRWPIGRIAVCRPRIRSASRMPNKWKRLSETKLRHSDSEQPEEQIEATETASEAVTVSKEPKAVINAG